MSHHYSGPDWAFPRGDARLDLADLYAFPKPDDNGKSIFVMNVHPSYGENPRGPTSNTPFAPEALYELKTDSDGDSVADIAYRVRFSPSQSGSQAATLCRAECGDAGAAGDQAKVGCKWSAERGRFNSSWFSDCPLRRIMPTLLANLRTTPSSFLPSRTRWSTLAVMHPKKRRASQRRCCQRCFSTIHRVRPLFPLTEGRSPTTPLIRSSRFSQMER